MSTSPSILTMDRLRAIIEGEFAAETVEVRDDKLHDSIGWSYDHPVVGLYPDIEVPLPSNANVQTSAIVVQFFNPYEKKIDPEQTVDPKTILALAHRFRQAVYTSERADAGTASLWFLRIEGIAYPDDPTGNKSRFVAQVRGWGDNAELIETGP